MTEYTAVSVEDVNVTTPPPYMDPGNAKAKKKISEMHKESVHFHKQCQHCGAIPNMVPLKHEQVQKQVTATFSIFVGPFAFKRSQEANFSSFFSTAKIILIMSCLKGFKKIGDSANDKKSGVIIQSGKAQTAIQIDLPDDFQNHKIIAAHQKLHNGTGREIHFFIFTIISVVVLLLLFFTNY
ncbi:unnamed protein product [Caenorhabditis bovis]|uniref:Uncharacterized protein n=1 Tax=Caenorhabditis bovis TaxID=2654633 RepID=A0A8S1EL85_9PELO|nr:unnamed protein product [Caenorhabditis bovis]